MSTESEITGDLPRTHPYAIPAAYGKPSTNAYAAKREEAALRLLEQHPATAEIMVRLAIFPNLDRARRRLRTMHRRREIGYMQAVEISKGVRRLVYSKHQITNPLHELQLTEVCLNMQAEEIRRLHAVDRRFNADAEVVIDGQTYYVELDRGTEGYAQVRKQMQNYQNANADVLWIVPTKTRMAGMMKRAAGSFWFTTYDQALTPHEEVWVNVHGEVTALPAPQGANA